MRNGSLRSIRRQPGGYLTISGLSQGIAQTYGIAPSLVRFAWVLLYALTNGAPTAVADGVLNDGLLGWLYVGWLLTGGSPVVLLYLFSWWLIPCANGQRRSRPLAIWLGLFFGPLVAMVGLALLPW